MNQAVVSEGVVDRLRRAHDQDVFEWVPVLDLASELFGSTVSPAQLDVLRRVLFRLGTDGSIEIASFRRRRDGGRLKTATRSDNQTVYELAFGTSGGLDKTATEYGVRLKAVE